MRRTSMLEPVTTDFQHNGIAIDPDGCGCTACLTGQAIQPRDSHNMDHLADDHMLFGRPIINRLDNGRALFLGPKTRPTIGHSVVEYSLTLFPHNLIEVERVFYPGESEYVVP